MKIGVSCSSMPLTELEASYGLVSRVNRDAQRLECDQLAGALERCRTPESGSKLHALSKRFARFGCGFGSASIASLRFNGASFHCMVAAKRDPPSPIPQMVLCP